MNIDLSALRANIQNEVDEAQSGGGRSKYPLVYVGSNGKLTFRLLFNIKGNMVQRRVIRHDAVKGKVPCMQAFGENCPACEAISNAENVKGKECGAFNKYGYKTRGICFAKIIDHDATYFQRDNDPKKGDVVTLMYPKTVYDKINDLILSSGDMINKLLTENEGIPFVIERSQKKGGFPSYDVSIYPFGSVKACETDAEFEDLLGELPDLNEQVVPQYPNDEMRMQCRALAETITQEYIGGMIMNPGDDVPTPPEKPSGAVNAAETVQNNQPVQQQVQNTGSGNPDCFGHHKDDDTMCMACPVEADCFLA